MVRPYFPFLKNLNSSFDYNLIVKFQFDNIQLELMGLGLSFVSVTIHLKVDTYEMEALKWRSYRYHKN
jgi:hypothetical protein